MRTTWRSRETQEDDRRYALSSLPFVSHLVVLTSPPSLPDLSRRPRKLSLALYLPFSAVVFSPRICKSVPSCLLVCLCARQGQAFEAARARCLGCEEREKRFLAHRPFLFTVFRCWNQDVEETNHYGRKEQLQQARNEEERPHRKRKRKVE